MSDPGPDGEAGDDDSLGHEREAEPEGAGHGLDSTGDAMAEETNPPLLLRGRAGAIDPGTHGPVERGAEDAGSLAQYLRRRPHDRVALFDLVGDAMGSGLRDGTTEDGRTRILVPADAIDVVGSAKDAQGELIQSPAFVPVSDSAVSLRSVFSDQAASLSFRPPAPRSDQGRRTVRPLLGSGGSRALILLGSIGIGLGTVLPWVSGIYLGTEFHWTAWNLSYHYWPHQPAGVVPVGCAVVTSAIAAFAGRRRMNPQRALGPALLVIGFLGFAYYTYAFGALGAQIHSIGGVSSSGIGLGFFVTVAGSLLAATAAVGADPTATSRTVLNHVELCVTGALVEIAVLADPIGEPLSGVILVAAALGAVIWMARLFWQPRSTATLPRAEA